MPFGQNSDDDQSMEYTLLDKDLKEVFNKKVNFPYKENNFGIVDHLIDSKGNIFVLAKISRNKRNTKDKKKTKEDARYYFSICYIAKNSTEAVENEIDLKGKYITDIGISMSPKGEVSCFGFYAELKKYALEGTFFAKLSSDGKLEEANYKKFDSEFLDMLISESTSKSVNKSGNISPEYELRSIDYQKDGSIIVLAEKYYVNVVCTQTNSGTRCTYYYHYDDVIIMKVSNGEIVWNALVPKRQVIINNSAAPFMSYAKVLDKDKLRLIYNDNPKNIAIEDSRKFKVMNNPKKSAAALITLDLKNGKFEKELLFDMKKDKSMRMYLDPKNGRQVGPKDLIVPATAKGKLRMVRFTF
jgi:hypothetical protein